MLFYKIFTSSSYFPFAGHGAFLRFPGRRADAAKPGQGPAPGTDQGRKGPCCIRAGDTAETCDKPGGHLTVGNQRQGLFQRQLVPSAGKSAAAVQFRRDAGHPSYPGGALHHLRQDVGGPEAGMGVTRRHDGDHHTAAWDLLGERADGEYLLPADESRSVRRRPPIRRKHGRQGGPVRHREFCSLSLCDNRCL